MWNGLEIRKTEHRMIELLYEYRGLTNNHFRQLLMGHLDSKEEGQNANVSRFVSGLRNNGLIKSVTCWPYSGEQIHYLTTKGVKYFHEHFKIEPTNQLAGFNSIHGDFTAALLKPTIGNLKHHMMFVDFAIQVYKKPGVAMRHNLYCVRHYDVINKQEIRVKKAAVKPDGEVKLKNGLIFALEIDTGSETYEQLVDKFRNYRQYFDYCTKNNIVFPWSGILIQTKRGNERLTFEKDPRWQNIIRAAVKGLSHYCWSIHVAGIYRTSLMQVLNEDLQKLKDLDIPIPPKENKKKLEEIKKEEERRKLLEKKRLAKEKQKDEAVMDELIIEALHRWEDLPIQSKTIKVGLFKRIEDRGKKDKFIINYVESRFHQRKKNKYGLLDFSHLDG